MSLTYAESRKIKFAHALYNVAAAIIVVVEGLRVVYFEKGLAFYMANPFFYAKLILFLCIGALAAYRKTLFEKWHAKTNQGLAPGLSEQEYGRIVALMRAEVFLLCCLVLCASLMAHGIGMQMH